MSTNETAGARSRSGVSACAAIVLALVVYLLMNHAMVQDLVAHSDPADREIYKTVVYSGWLLIGFALFFAFVVTAPLPLLVVGMAVFFVSVATNYAYIVIGKRPLSLDVMEWLPHEMAQLPNAWGEFGGDIAWAIFKAAAALAAFVLLRVYLRRQPWFRGSFVSSRAVWIVAAGALIAFNVAATVLQPPNTMAETNVFVFGIPALTAETPDLRPVAVSPEGAPLADKIVLIVDESVSYAIYRSTVAPAVARLAPIDFGEAASIANCSAASNALLRWGVERTRLRDPAYDPRTNPTIWAYAKRAGYRTTLIDAQTSGGLHNYLGRKEFALIDRFVPAQTDLDSDRAAAAMINEALQRPGRELVYVVKRGVHFPYEMHYPDGSVADTAPREEKYRAAVTYSTRGFFERIAGPSAFGHALVIYTSDHGQDLLNRSPHCNAEPLDTEYSVPLVVMTGIPRLRQALGAARAMHDHASHLNIFPTLLETMGYGRAWVEKEYGPTLEGPPGPYLAYVSLGWAGPTNLRERHTVAASKFVETEGFPRRAARGAATAR